MLLKPVMYRIGDLWEQGKLDVATEHASTNNAIGLIKVINERITSRVRTGKLSSQNKSVICTPEGFKVYNISTSIPTEYIIDFMRDSQPDIIFIPITLVENIKPAERLIHKIHQKYNNRLPVLVGGSALNKIDKNLKAE